MTDPAQPYYERYLYNVGLAKRIEATLPASDLGWACVAMFYASLHLMNAYLVSKTSLPFDPLSSVHADRKRAMDACPELRDAPGKHRQLKDLSESVRYDPGFIFGPAHLAAAKVHLARVVGIVDPKVKRILGIS